MPRPVVSCDKYMTHLGWNTRRCVSSFGPLSQRGAAARSSCKKLATFYFVVALYHFAFCLGQWLFLKEEPPNGHTKASCLLKSLFDMENMYSTISLWFGLLMQKIVYIWLNYPSKYTLLGLFQRLFYLWKTLCCPWTQALEWLRLVCSNEFATALQHVHSCTGHSHVLDLCVCIPVYVCMCVACFRRSCCVVANCLSWGIIMWQKQNVMVPWPQKKEKDICSVLCVVQRRVPFVCQWYGLEQRT